MARKKVKLQFIENDTARKVSYKKRVKCVVNKTQELSILCGVDACAVMYGPYDQAPVVWPSSETEARRVLLEYMGKTETDPGQRKLDQEAYLRQSFTKSNERLQRLVRRNRETEMENVMNELLSTKPIEQVPFFDLQDLTWIIDDKLRTVQHRIRKLDSPGNYVNPTVGVAANHHGDVMMAGINEMIGLNGLVPFDMQAGPSQPLLLASHLKSSK